jgi:hypothetical protein
MLKVETLISNDSVLAISKFILVVQGNLQEIHSPKEKEKKCSSKVVKILVGTKKSGKPWYVKENVGRSAKVLNKKMGTTYSVT